MLLHHWLRQAAGKRTLRWQSLAALSGGCLARKLQLALAYTAVAMAPVLGWL